MLDNTSSSSLRNMEIGVPPGHTHPPPPPATVAAYETKPLPPLPVRRSGISSFSKEIQNALRTPTSADYHMPEVQRDVREASIAVILDTDSVAPRQEYKVDSGYTFTETPIQETHSLMPTGSVQKLLQITGAGSAASLALTNTSLTPSGHNSTHKIKQIMGFEVPLDGSQGSRGAAHEISPLTSESCSSSIYSQDRDGAVSEADTDAGLGRERLSTPETSVTLSSHLDAPGFWRPASAAPSAVPASLHIVKTRDRRTFSPGLSPLTEPSSPTTNNYSHANGAFKQDMYHTTVSELAQSTSSSSAYSVTSGSSERGLYIGEVPARQPSFSNRRYQSKTRFAPQLSKINTLNPTKYNAPVKTPYPLPPSRFEFDDDDTTPTQKDYDSDVSPRTTSSRPSLMDRIIRRASSPLSPTSHCTPAFEPTTEPTRRTHASALHLKPPPLLKHRKVRSQDTPRNDTHALSNISTNHRVSTSKTVTPTPQNYTAPVNRTAIPTAQPTRRTSTPTPSPFVPPPNHNRSRIPPPVPPRGPPPHLPKQHASKPSLAESTFTHLSVWAGRTAERLEAARQAAGIRTRSERRRHRLKGNIKVIGPGKLQPGTPPLVVSKHPPPPAAVRPGAGGGEVKVGRASDKYSHAQTRAVPEAGRAAAASSVERKAFEKYAPEKTAEKARGREEAAAAAGVKVWI